MRIWDADYLNSCSRKIFLASRRSGYPATGIFDAAAWLQKTPCKGMFVAGIPFRLERQNREMDEFLVYHQVFELEDLAQDGFVLSNESWENAIFSLIEAYRLFQTTDANLALISACSVGIIRLTSLIHQDGGSVSSALGYLYLAPKPHWSPLYWAEMLAHEATHNSLFWVDMSEGLFPDLEALGHPSALAESAIRGEMRPLDRAYHSAFVALTIARINRLGGNLGRAARAHARLAPTLASLRRAISRSNSAGLNTVTGTAVEMLDELDAAALEEGAKL